jgi:hypothetical protein
VDGYKTVGFFRSEQDALGIVNDVNGLINPKLRALAMPGKFIGLKFGSQEDEAWKCREYGVQASKNNEAVSTNWVLYCPQCVYPSQSAMQSNLKSSFTLDCTIVLSHNFNGGYFLMNKLKYFHEGSNA